VLTGLRAPDAGTADIGETVRVAAIDQHREDLDPEKTVVQEIAGSVEYVRVGGNLQRIEGFLNSFLFPGESKHTQIKLLSGGEKNRVLLAKLLLQAGNVLVLDEPTNDLDLPTLRALEEALVAFEGTVIVVSHDRWFLDRVATEIVHLDGRGRCLKWGGDMSTLLERLAAERVAAEAAAAAACVRTAAPEPPRETPARARKLGTRQREELDALPARIEDAEARLAALDARLADPAFWRGAASDREQTVRDRASLSDEVARLYARWAELETQRAAGADERP
jgi:ATP-binding cassette subfamily F protein uup